MTPEMLAHIRADVQTAMVENRETDPALLPELLDYLLTEISKIALSSRDGWQFVMPQAWAGWLLEQVQLRAISQVPFGEPTGDGTDPAYDPDWRDHL